MPCPQVCLATQKRKVYLLWKETERDKVILSLFGVKDR